MIEAGYSIDIICLRLPGEKSREVKKNLRIYRLPYKHRRKGILEYIFRYLLSFTMMSAIVTILHQKRGYDLIQVNTMPDFLVFATWYPRLTGAKILLDLHEPTPELWKSKFEKRKMRFLIRFMERIEQMAISYADQSITVNETIRQRFIERGADEKKISIIRNVPSETFQKSGIAQLPEDQFKIITHGSIEKRYGHELILQALTLLKDRIPGIHLYIVGDGEDAPQLRQKVSELSLSEDVTFTGWVPIETIPRLIAAADLGIVSILPTAFGELCQPNKLFEYVALQKPVVAPRLPAITESFDDDSLIYFEPGNPADLADRVEEFYRNPQIKSELAQNAFRVYERLKWSRVKTDYVKGVASMISASGLFGPAPAGKGADGYRI